MSEKVSVSPGDVTKKNLRAKSGKNLYRNQTRIFARDFLVGNSLRSYDGCCIENDTLKYNFS